MSTELRPHRDQPLQDGLHMVDEFESPTLGSFIERGVFCCERPWHTTGFEPVFSVIDDRCPNQLDYMCIRDRRFRSSDLRVMSPPRFLCAMSRV